MVVVLLCCDCKCVKGEGTRCEVRMRGESECEAVMMKIDQRYIRFKEADFSLRGENVV